MIDRTKAPKIAGSVDLDDLKLPKIETEILSNGCKLNVINGSEQDLMFLMLSIPGGELESHNRSIPLLAAPTMLEGTTTKSGAEISEIIDFNGARFQISCTQHHTNVILATLNSKTKDVLQIVNDVLQNPSFPEPVLKVFRDKAVKKLLMSKTQVGMLAQNAIDLLIKGTDNLGARQETEEGIMGVTREELLAFHHKMMKGSGCQAFLAGRVTDQNIAEVRALLESLPNGDACPLHIDPFAPEAPQLVKVEKKDAMQNSIRMALPAPLIAHPDSISLQMTVTALGGYFGSRLMKNIREDKGYTYGIGSNILNSLDGSIMQIYADADPSYIDPLIEEVKKEIVKLASEPMGPEELERLKQNAISEYIETLNGPFYLCSFCHYLSRIGVEDIEAYFNRLVKESLEITPGKIMEMAAKYLHPDQLRIAVAGK